MDYFISSLSSDCVYSIDKLCILGKFSFTDVKSFSFELSNFLLSRFQATIRDDFSLPFGSENSILDYKHIYRYGIGEYRNNLNILVSNGSSFYFGFFHNSNKNNGFTWKVELNPNKCLPCNDFFDFLHFIYSRSLEKYIRISQIDLAIDFKFPRSSFVLEKDRRVYSLVNDGNGNITEYLSKHNSHGFCKLYDKSKESNLNYALTRFEITLKRLDVQSVVNTFPVLRVFDNSQIVFSDLLQELNQNDSVFLDLLRLHPEYLKSLTYRKRKLFEPYLSLCCPVYEFDTACYLDLINKLYEVFL